MPYTTMVAEVTSIMSNYSDCAVLMDSHVPVYKEYIDLERKYGFETKELKELELYGEHTHLQEWHGRTENQHPGRVAVRQYTNLLLNYACDWHSKKKTAAAKKRRRRRRK